MKPCPSILEQLEGFPPAGKGIGMAIGTAVILGRSLEQGPGSDPFLRVTCGRIIDITADSAAITVRHGEIRPTFILPASYNVHVGEKREDNQAGEFPLQDSLTL